MFAKLTLSLTTIALISLATLVNAQNVDWQSDLDQAKQLAARDNKLVLIHFYADWCGPCQQLDTFVFNRESVSRAIDQGMVPVKIDIDVHPDLVDEYGVKSIPFDVVISPNGNLVHRQKSPTTSDNYQSMVARLSGINARLGEQGDSINPSMFQRQVASRPANNPLDQVDSMEFGSTSTDFRPAKNQTAMQPSDGQFRPQSQSGPSAQARTMGTIDFANNSNVGNTQTNQHMQAESAQAFRGNQPADSSFSPRPQRVVNEIAQSTMNPSEIQEPVFNTNSIRTQPNEFRARIRTGSAETAQLTSQAKEVRQPVASIKIKNEKPVVAAPPKPRISFALNGNCPVSLLTISKWVPGNETFGCAHRGKTYLFASQAHMDTFLADPDKYSPVLAGFDPVDFSEKGVFNEGEESLGVFMSKGGVQKIVLFQSVENRKKFQEDPKRYLEAVRVATEKIDGTEGTVRR
jgi:YHS domain-containing protein/thiol-disulfide isomerase/thioredoxin